MLKYLDTQWVNMITPILIFCFVFFKGCVTSGIETVESDEIESDGSYIKHIYNIKLNNGKILTDNDYNFEIESLEEQESKINCYQKDLSDTINNPGINLYENFTLSEIKTAKVKFKNKPTMTGYIIGSARIIGFIALIFVANGARNERK